MGRTLFAGATTLDPHLEELRTLKSSRFTEEQIIGILRENDGGVETANLNPSARLLAIIWPTASQNQGSERPYRPLLKFQQRHFRFINAARGLLFVMCKDDLQHECSCLVAGVGLRNPQP